MRANKWVPVSIATTGMMVMRWEFTTVTYSKLQGAPVEQGTQREPALVALTTAALKHSNKGDNRRPGTGPEDRGPHQQTTMTYASARECIQCCMSFTSGMSA